jgi:hypothetical protein
MASFFDLNTSAGQFRALVLLYLLTVGLRCWGFQWAEQDHTLILGALLCLLRGHIQEAKQ